MISVLKIVQNMQKWLFNVYEETDVRNVTLNPGKNLKQVLNWCKCVPCVCSYWKKAKSTLDS